MDGTGTSQARDNAPNSPPIPPTLVEVIATLVNATTLLAQNQNVNQGHRGQNNRGETTYVDFIDTRPPMFSKADEPLEADDWLRTIEKSLIFSNARTIRNMCLQPYSSGVLQGRGG
jgi:hypothetical protein